MSLSLRRRVLLATLLAITLPILPAAAQRQPGPRPAIEYTVHPDLATQHFVVHVTLRNIPGDTIIFHFPIWAPGAYDIANFGSYVDRFTATPKGGTPVVTRIDTNSFRIAGRYIGEMEIDYEIRNVEPPRNTDWYCASDIEQAYAFGVGAAIFGYPDGFKDVPCTVSYGVPPGMRIAVALDSAARTETHDGYTWHQYRAASYDDLIDAPVEMGTWQQSSFVVRGVPHLITVRNVVGSDTVNMRNLTTLTRRVVEIETDFFGEIPYPRYVFQHWLADLNERKVDGGFGALEHSGSSTYLLPTPSPGEDYADVTATTIAHEYWHVWSPKRIHVGTLGPFDYQHAPKTTSLWFAEGLTEYYSRVLLVRNGVISMQQFLHEADADVRGSYGRPQRPPVTVISRNISGLDESIVSRALYSVGPMIGLLLDAAIRTQTNNAKSLDDAMRLFNREYGRTGKTFSDEEIIPIMERATGAKLQEFYARYIDSTEPLPYDQYLPKIGLAYGTVTERRRQLGATLAPGDSGIVVTLVKPGLSADASGLRVNDRITGLLTEAKDTLRAAELPESFIRDDMLVRLPIAAFLVRRNGSDLALPVRVVEREEQVHRLTLDPSATGQALAIRKSMIGQ
ncbi:MAG TPA: hypothetical protein VHI13_11180 [Candidatus Kapabacteria bacterium]|nr:hypothetical protein [Candidatus Kapabacteria bacterium]